MKKPGFMAALKDNVLELSIYEEIGEDFWTGSGVTAKSVKQQIDAAAKFSSVSVRINSPGGDAFEGVAVFNLLRSIGKPVNVFIDGIAASAASIIAMAGDSIEMGPNAMIMIHNAWGMCMGNGDEMRKMADTLDRVSSSIAQTYVQRTGNDMAGVKAMMDAETWMGAEEAKEKGFCTSIAKSTDKKAMARAAKFKALAGLRNVPDALKAAGCSCSCEECAEGECAECTHQNCECAGCTCGGMNDKADPVAADDAAKINASDLEFYERQLQLMHMRSRP